MCMLLLLHITEASQNIVCKQVRFVTRATLGSNLNTCRMIHNVEEYDFEEFVMFKIWLFSRRVENSNLVQTQSRLRTVVISSNSEF